MSFESVGSVRQGLDAAPDADAGACPDPTVVTSADIDGEIGWKPPNAVPSACSSADIAKLAAILDDESSKSWDDLFAKLSSAGLPAACLSCAVSDSTAPKWGPIVKLASGAGLFNYGACFANQTSDACGKAVEYTNVCINNACADCASDASYQTCTGSKGTDTACAGPTKDEQAACSAFAADINSESSALSKACNNIVNAVTKLCSGGAPSDSDDGGTGGASGGPKGDGGTSSAAPSSEDKGCAIGGRGATAGWLVAVGFVLASVRRRRRKH
mgnify:CR=1 FL=1